MSRKLNKSNKKGFTLIEVVLVLAIGGLIFLLAFIAFRNASANRRDGQRRSDVSRMVAEVNNYIGDVGLTNTAPTIDNFKTIIIPKYLGNPFNGPTGDPYEYTSNTVSKPGNTAGKDAGIKYTPGPVAAGSNAACNGAALGARDFKIQIGLEKGADACRDSL